MVKAIPYGIYDLTMNQGWVNVGIDHETAEFPVASILYWWYSMGQKLYPNTQKLLMRWHDQLLSRKRAIIETIIDQLKNISQIEHSRYSSPVNFCVNLLCDLIAYCHQPKKPSLDLESILSHPA